MPYGLSTQYQIMISSATTTAISHPIACIRPLPRSPTSHQTIPGMIPTRMASMMY